MDPRSIARRPDTSARRPQSRAVLRATRDLVLPTTITGSYPRPQWFVEELRGRGFKDALGDSRFREQYLDAVACLVREQEMAGLDIVTDGDSRFDLTVGGKSWFFYVIERLRGITGHVDRAAAGGWRGLPPGHILREVMEAYQPAVVGEAVSGASLQYAALFKTAQRLSARPVKFGAITGQSLAKMLVNRHYASDRELILALAEINNAEFKEVAAAGCRVIQVEEPQHHRTDKKIAIGVVNHSTAAVEPPEFVANLIRRALEYVPPERLVLSTDCGFGREGLARRIAFYKCVAINLGANLVRRELKLPE